MTVNFPRAQKVWGTWRVFWEEEKQCLLRNKSPWRLSCFRKRALCKTGECKPSRQCTSRLHVCRLDTWESSPAFFFSSIFWPAVNSAASHFQDLVPARAEFTYDLSPLFHFSPTHFKVCYWSTSPLKMDRFFAFNQLLRSCPSRWF